MNETQSDDRLREIVRNVKAGFRPELCEAKILVDALRAAEAERDKAREERDAWERMWVLEGGGDA